jgi:hypothetical protein
MLGGLASQQQSAWFSSSAFMSRKRPEAAFGQTGAEAITVDDAQRPNGRGPARGRRP